MTAMAAQRPIEIQRRLVELGRVRMGEKGSRGEPKQRSTWRLTSASRRLLEAVAQTYGGTVHEWKDAPDEGYFELATDASELDILIPPTITSYSFAYELWDRGGLLRRCDGATEALSEGNCICRTTGETLCQPTTRVSIMLPKVPGLGVWRLDTKGWNAAATLPATLETLRALAPDQWVPAVLRIERQSKRTRVNGKPQTRRYVVPVIDIVHGTIGQAIEGGLAVGPAPQIGPGRVNRREKVPRPALPPGPEPPTETSFATEPTADFGQSPDLPASPAADPETGEVIEGGDVPFGGPVDDVPVPAATSAQPTGDDIVTRLKRVAYANHDRHDKPSTAEQRAALRELFDGVELGVVRALLVRAFDWQAPANGKIAVDQAQAQALLEVSHSNREAFLVEVAALAGAREGGQP